jgi:uncharacterized protein YacL
MNHIPTIYLLRILFLAFTGYLGSEIGDSLLEAPKTGVCAGIAFGLTVVLADSLLKGFSLRMFSSATFGLFLGVIASRLLLASGILYRTHPDGQWLISLVVYATFAYIGMMLALRSNRDVLVDSNIIIDGRLPDIIASGFLSSSLIIPRFILQELQTLADSSDPARREKGRLALARLEEMQRNPALSVTIHEGILDPFSAVDAKLVQLARMTNARLITNDSNLCSIARLQNVIALNLNDLAKALRPVLHAGDELALTLTKEGREPHQAVGYLTDGTMIVVNHARSFMGKNVRVSISSTLQTAAGRLFFAELKAAA